MRGSAKGERMNAITQIAISMAGTVLLALAGGVAMYAACIISGREDNDAEA